jgi:F-type H+-transporting ATPase subunit b
MLVQLNPGLIIWTIVTFVVLMVVLKLVAWKPLLAMLDERERRIRESMEGAERARREAELALEKNRQAMAEARKEALELLNRGQREAETLRQELTARAHEEAQRLVAEGKRQIEQETRAAVAQIRREAVELALAAAEKALGEALDERSHRRLIEEHIEALRGIDKSA